MMQGTSEPVAQVLEPIMEMAPVEFGASQGKDALGQTVRINVIREIPDGRRTRIPGVQANAGQEQRKRHYQQRTEAADAALLLRNIVLQLLGAQPEQLRGDEVQHLSPRELRRIHGQKVLFLQFRAEAFVLASARNSADDDGDDSVRTAKPGEVPNLLVDPIHPLCIRISRIRRADDNQVFRLAQLLPERIPQRSGADRHVILADRTNPDIASDLLPRNARQPVEQELAMDPVRPLGVLVAVADERIISEARKPPVIPPRVQIVHTVISTQKFNAPGHLSHYNEERGQ